MGAIFRLLVLIGLGILLVVAFGVFIDRGMTKKEGSETKDGQ